MMRLQKLDPIERRKRANMRNAGLRKATLCTWCASAAEPNRSLCRVHLDAVSERERRNRELAKRRDLARMSAMRGAR